MQTWSRIVARAGATLETFVPPEMAAGSDEASRAHLAAAVSFMLCFIRAGLACLHLASGRYGEASVNAALATVTFSAPFLMRKSGRYPFVVNGAIAVSVAAMGFVAFKDRGPGINASTMALALIPLFATLLAGVRAGTVWTALSCAVSVVIGRWAPEPLPDNGAPARLNEHVVLVMVTVALFLVAVFYERGRARQLARITELEARRHAVDLERLRTITEARLAQGEHLASLGRVAEAVAHEMNNPLSYVLTNLEFLEARVRKEGWPPDVRDALADGIDGARRLERIVAELFQFMRPVRATGDAGNVGEAIRAAVEIAAGRLRGKAPVQVDLADLPPVRGSTLQLMHVFLNLVVNATQNIHGGTTGEHRIEIGGATENGRVRIEVLDTGEGNSPGILGHASASIVTTDPPGHGPDLGLALARTILESIGGRLEFEGRPGRTVARVWLAPAHLP